VKMKIASINKVQGGKFRYTLVTPDWEGPHKVRTLELEMDGIAGVSESQTIDVDIKIKMFAQLGETIHEQGGEKPPS